MDKSLVADEAGLRLDQFLARRLEGLTRAYCRGMIEQGLVTVNGARRPPDHRLAGGEVVRVRSGEPAWARAPFESWVLHEDKDLLILHKPAGILTHPMGTSWESRPEAALADPEANLAGLLVKFRPQVLAAGVSRCGIVHRLDRQTSGVWAAALRPEAQAALLEAFRSRQVRKTYRAVVLGELESTQVEAPVGRLPGRRKVQVTPWGKSAMTDFKTVETAGELSLVEARPVTGRTHQIRAHLALLKRPVVGDPEWFREPERSRLRRLGLAEPPRMLLHAYRLRFQHPASGKDVSFTAPLPKDFRDYWRECLKRRAK